MMKLEQQWFAVLAFCATVIMPLPSFAAAPAYISEVAWAGSSLSASDEWIEILNTTENNLDMSGWSLTGAGSKETDIVLPEGSVVAPNSTFLIGNYDAQHENSTLAIEPNFVTASLSLPNSGLHLHLLDNDFAVVDVAGGTGAPFAGGSGGTADALDGRYTSMVRVDGLVSGEEKTNWMDAALSRNLDENVTDFATPGMHPIAERIVEKEIPVVETESSPEENADFEVTTEEEIEFVKDTGQEVHPTEPEEDLETVSETEGVDETVEKVIQDTNEEVVTTEFIEETEAPIEETESEPTAEKEALDEVKPEESSIMETKGVETKDTPTPNIIVSEFLAAPDTEQDEWVELKNMDDTVVDLTDWTLEDESGKQTILEGTIEPAAFFLVVKPNGKLNNGGDSIIVKNELGEEMLSLTYGNDEVPAGKKGESIVLDGDRYHPTQIHTPGKPNLIFIPVAQVNEEKIQEIEQENETTKETLAIPEPEIAIEEVLNTTIQLTSLYPNTNGKDETEEYIKLQNTGSDNLSLEGWSISDESGKQYVFNAGVELAPNEELMINRTETKIALNNTGDTVFLHAPNKKLIDQVTYSKSTKGETYDRSADGWSWSQTVEATNESTKEVSQQQVRTTTTTLSYVPSNKTIAELTALPVGNRATVSGVVTATPNSLGKQFFYIQDETGGIQIYFYKATFPEMQIGDVISVTGELTSTRGEPRLKISNANAITHQAGDQDIQIENVKLTELNKEHVGSLVEVTGMLQSKTSTKLVLEHNGETLTVHLGSNGLISTETYQRGDELVVTGIVSIYNDNLRVRPRSQDDIIVLEKEKEEIVPVVGSTKNNMPLSNQGQTGTFLLLLTFVVFVGLALARLIPRQKPMNA
jgi:DNA/RNA endonuclease YhcR with UshA esterase domain